MVKIIPPVAISLLFASSMLIGAQAQERATARPAVASSRSVAPLTFPRAGETEKQWAVIEDYCMGCHTGDSAPGNPPLDFDKLSPADIATRPEIFEKIVRKVRGHMMPPPGEDRPDEAATNSFVTWLEDSLDYNSAVANDPGSVPLHRLNRREYANAVRDILDLKIDASQLLPSDDAFDGFDNVAQALQVSPSFLDNYLVAARLVAVQAIGQPNARPGSGFYTPGPDEGNRQTQHVEGLPFGTRGGLVAEHYFPSDGEYEININDMAGGVYFLGIDYAHEVVVVLDGKEIYRTRIGGYEDTRAIDQLQAPATDAINSRLKAIKFHAPSGTHKIGVTFVARSFAESESKMNSVSPGSGIDRVPRVASFEVRGPFEASGLSETPTRERIFTCRPTQASQEAACADKILSTIARRAYRRPVTEVDMAQLRPFYQSGREQGGFEEGIRAGLTRILASPDFLYRVEEDKPDSAPGTVRDLTDLELASRLSFFLWSSVPDDQLLEIASKNQLRRPGVLQTQVERMLKDPKAMSLVDGFAFQWLHVSKLDDVQADMILFPAVAVQRDQVGFNGDARKEMKEELRLFIGDIFSNNAPIPDLLTANYTYLNERLAFHYDIFNVKGDRFRRVTLDKPERRGLLGKAAILMAYSYPDRTSPVLRGNFILENILGTPPSPPPPSVEANLTSIDPSLTVRERMEIHRTSPTCSSCHKVMDPLGLALENFDATGAWIANDPHARRPIDATSILPDGRPINGVNELRDALASQSEEFVQTFTEKLAVYALARPVKSADMRLIRQIVRDASKDNYKFNDIILGLVNSDLFQKRSTPLPANPGSTQVASQSQEVAAR